MSLLVFIGEHLNSKTTSLKPGTIVTVGSLHACRITRPRPWLRQRSSNLCCHCLKMNAGVILNCNWRVVTRENASRMSNRSIQKLPYAMNRLIGWRSEAHGVRRLLHQRLKTRQLSYSRLLAETLPVPFPVSARMLTFLSTAGVYPTTIWIRRNQQASASASACGY